MSPPSHSLEGYVRRAICWGRTRIYNFRWSGIQQHNARVVDVAVGVPVFTNPVLDLHPHPLADEGLIVKYGHFFGR